MLTAQSRYRYTTGQDVPYIAVRRDPTTPKYALYTAMEGDSFDSIAAKTLNNPERYWEIADINPHIPFPDFVPTGAVLRIPIV